MDDPPWEISLFFSSLHRNRRLDGGLPQPPTLPNPRLGKSMCTNETNGASATTCGRIKRRSTNVSDDGIHAIQSPRTRERNEKDDDACIERTRGTLRCDFLPRKSNAYNGFVRVVNGVSSIEEVSLVKPERRTCKMDESVEISIEQFSRCIDERIYQPHVQKVCQRPVELCYHLEGDDMGRLHGFGSMQRYLYFCHEGRSLSLASLFFFSLV